MKPEANDQLDHAHGAEGPWTSDFRQILLSLLVVNRGGSSGLSLVGINGYICREASSVRSERLLITLGSC